MRHALLLAGGQGRRFWPKSRRRRPKQFMSLDGRESLLAATSRRLAAVVPPARQWVVTSAEYVQQVRQSLPSVPADQVIGEPLGRNTAPAIGLGAALIRARDPDAVMVVQAADHWIRDVPRFQQLVEGAFAHVEAEHDALLIGFKPERAATGYGYIETGRKLRARRGLRLFEVRSYKEKPSLPTARSYLKSGRYLWNGCLFFWHAATILEGIAVHLPELAGEVEQMARKVAAGIAVEKAARASYRHLESISIEHGVVEKLARKVVLEGDCGWEDVGTWLSLAAVIPEDRDGNVVQGLHLGIDTRRTTVLGDQGLVVTLGVSDLIVVRDGNALLILPRSREDEMRQVVERIERDPRLKRFL